MLYATFKTQVTSGVHKREDIQRLGVFPDHVVDDLRELIG